MENIHQILNNAIKSIKIADHMAYVTYPLVTEHKLLLKIFNEIYNSTINCIKSILMYESSNKKIPIYTDSKNNLKTFLKIANQYNLTNEQIKTIIEIIEIYDKHKKSAMEFVKNNKVVILSDSLKTDFIDIKQIKNYIFIIKKLIISINKKIKL